MFMRQILTFCNDMRKTCQKALLSSLIFWAFEKYLTEILASTTLAAHNSQTAFLLLSSLNLALLLSQKAGSNNSLALRTDLFRMQHTHLDTEGRTVWERI